MLLLMVACSSYSRTAKITGNSPTPPLMPSQKTKTTTDAYQPGQKYSSGSLSLLLTSPLDGSETNLPQTELVGNVSENAVLSINDEIYVLNAGNFTQKIPLEAGLNVFQIVVSDDAGNEIDLVLTVTYNAD